MSVASSPIHRIPSRHVDPYAAARTALEQLGASQSDFGAFAEYLKALVALGLAGAGQRLIERASASIASESDGRRVLDQLAEVVARCPSGRANWDSCSDRLLSNLAVLRRRLPAVCELIAAADVSGYELYRDTRGVPHILELEPLQWLSGLADRRAAAIAAFLERSAIQPSAPMLFDGIGFGELFDEFMRRSRNTFLSYSAAATVVEPDPVALSLAFRLHEWEGILAESRLSIFTGPQAEKDFLAQLVADPDQPIPVTIQRMPLTRRARAQLSDALARLAIERTERKHATLVELENLHRSRDHRFWANRFAQALDGRGKPLRVMGITSRFTTVLRYSMRELLDGAARAGCETELVWEQSDHAVEYNVPARARQFEPDLIVMLSRLRHEFPDIPRQVPFLCWDQDALPVMRTAEAGEHLDRLTFVAGYGAWFGLSHLGWPATQALAEVPIAASHAYVSAPNEAPIDDRFRCDIAYISHCSESPRQMRDRVARDWSSHPVVHRIYQAVTDRLLDHAAAGHNWTPSELYALVGESAAEAGVRLVDVVAREMCMACMSLSDRAFRHHALECVARYCEQSRSRLHLYGNGWDRHPRFSPYAAGHVSFGSEFVAACRGARLNLQLIEGGFLHSRSLDGLAAGGAFLTRATRYDAERPALKALAMNLGRRGVSELTPAERAGLATSGGLSSDCKLDGLDFWLKTIPLEPDARALLPDLPSISFTDFDSLISTADALLSDDTSRRQIAARMRSQALSRFTYDLHWAQLIGFVHGSLQRP